MKRKFLENKVMLVVMAVATALLFCFVGSILYTIVSRGLPSLTWSMLTELPGGEFYIGREGGLLNAIVGSLLIVGMSTVLGLVVSIPVVFYLNVYLRPRSKFGYVVRLCFDVLFGVPSIVYGAFAYTVMIALGLRTSLLGGVIVITLLIIPIFVRSMDEVARLMPRDILSASYSLGATRLQSVGVLVRQIMPGIATATLLSVGRAIGDAAAVMFTTGYTDSIPLSLSQPAATLPLAVFFQLSSPMPEVQQRAYSAALILTIIVLILSVVGRVISSNAARNRIK